MIVTWKIDNQRILSIDLFLNIYYTYYDFTQHKWIFTFHNKFGIIYRFIIQSKFLRILITKYEMKTF